MPVIGEVRSGREIGYIGNTDKYAWHACIDCGKERWVRLLGGILKSIRCLSCAHKLASGYKGNKTSRWKGGRKKNSRGYILVRLYPNDPFYPMCEKKGYVMEHRLIVAKHLGRCLYPWEIVHHKGTKYPKGSIENRSDNRYPENLQLVTDNRHKQITILEERIKFLERRVILLEAENIKLVADLKDRAKQLEN